MQEFFSPTSTSNQPDATDEKKTLEKTDKKGSEEKVHYYL